MQRVISLVAIFLGLLGGVAEAADSYPVRLSLPAHPGEIYVFSVKVKHTRVEKWSDGPNENKPIETTLDAAMEGTGTIEKVTPNGSVLRLKIDIAKCTKDGHELLPKGTIVVAETVNAFTQYTVDGVAATADQRTVLIYLILTARPDEPTSDEKIGTNKPQEVGAAWPVNGDALAKATHLPFQIKGADFKGQSKLLAVVEKDGELSETIQESHICAFDRREGSNGTVNQNLSRKFELTITVPLNHKSHRASAVSAVTFSETYTDAKGTRDIHDQISTTAQSSDVVDSGK